MSQSTQQYVKVHTKSQVAGFVLTFFFGPLGLFYSNWVAGLIFSAFALILFGTIIVPILCWILAIIISFFTVSAHNRKVAATAALLDKSRS